MEEYFTYIASTLERECCIFVQDLAEKFGISQTDAVYILSIYKDYFCKDLKSLSLIFNKSSDSYILRRSNGSPVYCYVKPGHSFKPFPNKVKPLLRNDRDFRHKGGIDRREIPAKDYRRRGDISKDYSESNSALKIVQDLNGMIYYIKNG